MNSVLSYLAAVIVLVLFAALIGPSFVDWNQFRAEFEGQAHAITGLDVSIDGDIGFAVLPAPRLKLQQVTAANPQAPDRPHPVQLEELEAEVALAPLLRGNLTVTSITIKGPRLTVDIRSDGSSNWDGIAGRASAAAEGGDTAAAGFVSPASISFDDARFEDGVLTFRDVRSRTDWQLEDLSGAVTAGSLLGPVRASAEFVVDGQPGRVRLALGDFGGGKAFPVSAEILVGEPELTIAFSGIATEFADDGRLDGAITLAAGGERNGEVPLIADAGLVAGARGASLRNLEVTAGATVFGGEAEIDLEEARQFTITLAAPTATLDSLKKAAAAVAPAADALALLPGMSALSGSATISADGLVVGKATVEDIAVALDLGANKMRVTSASGRLPGYTTLSFEGDLRRADAGIALEGKAAADVSNVRAFGAWLRTVQPGAETLIPAGEGAPIQQATAAALVTLTGTGVRFDDLQAGYGAPGAAKPVTGTVSYQIGERTSLDVALTVSDFNLDPVLGAVPLAWRDMAAGIAEMDSRAVLSAESLTVRGVDVRDVDVAAALTEGTLTIDRFSVEDIAGARLSVESDDDGVQTTLQGGIRGRLETGELDRIVRLAGWEPPGLLGAADLDFSVRSSGGAQPEVSIDLGEIKGIIGGTRLEVTAERQRSAGSDDPAKIDIAAAVSNPQGAVLFRQLGFASGDEGALRESGAFVLRLSGEEGGDLATTLEATYADAGLILDGAARGPWNDPGFDGRATMSASTPSLWSALRLTGVGETAARWATAQIDGATLAASAAISRAPERFALSDIDIVGGPFRMAGSVLYEPERDGERASITGAVTLSRLMVDPLFETPTGSINDGQPDVATDVIPVVPLDWRALGAADGDLEIAVGGLRLAGLNLEDAKGALTLKDGVLTVPLSGGFADGSMTLEARLEGGAGTAPVLELALAVDKANAEKAAAMTFGAPFATGAVDATLSARGTGRSLSGLLGSLSGSGTITAAGGALRGFDLAVLRNGLLSLEDAGNFPALERRTFSGGETEFTELAAGLSVENGVIKLTAPNLTIPGVETDLDAYFDIPRQAVDAELGMTFDEPRNMPPFRIVATGKPGDVAARHDTVALEEFMAARLLAESVERTGVDAIPAELRELMGMEESGGVVRVAPLPLPRPQRAS